MDRGRGARSTVDQWWHRPKASELGRRREFHSGAWKLTGGGATVRGEHGELGSGLIGARAAAWRPGDSGETTEERELNNSGTHASEEGEE
jgi:hypothetical protein